MQRELNIKNDEKKNVTLRANTAHFLCGMMIIVFVFLCTFWLAHFLSPNYKHINLYIVIIVRLCKTI